MIYDSDFLHRFDKQKNKIIHARVTALTFDERPIEMIEGRVTAGTINVDGTSAVRRTCQLTLVAPEVSISNYYWGLNTKFKLEIGVENQTDAKYSDIIWFNQGLYVITGFNVAFQPSSYVININGKDKMCLLNGELGGIFSSSVDLGQLEETTENGVKLLKIPVKQIIRDMVHQYGNEPFHNIIINDLDELGLQLQEYNYEQPLYLFRKAEEESNVYYKGTLDSGTECVITPPRALPTEGWSFVSQEDEKGLCVIESIGLEDNLDFDEIAISDDGILTVVENNYYYGFEGSINENGILILGNAVDLRTNIADSRIIYDSLVEPLTEIDKRSTLVSLQQDGSQVPAYIAKIDFGETAGYKEIDLIYPDELIANAGDSITVILDKIKQFLGSYEYFYDLDGHFVFQKQKSQINTNWSPINSAEKDNVYVEELEPSHYEYIFSGSELFTAINNVPDLANLRNDYTVWGTKKSATGKELPAHMRYAIDTKPLKYTSIAVKDKELEQYNKLYNFTLLGQDSVTYIADGYYGYQADGIHCDWREIIYQMAKDYRRYNHLDDFELRIIRANEKDGLYNTGITGYEQYYIDLEGFWRQLYNPEPTYHKTAIEAFDPSQKYYILDEAYVEVEAPRENDHRKYYIQSGGSYEHVVSPFSKEQTYYIKEEKYRLIESEFDQEEVYYVQNEDFYHSNSSLFPWLKDIYNAPEKLVFWLDFLDLGGDLNKYGVQLVGDRPKVVNDNQVKAIYYRETPLIIFQDFEEGNDIVTEETVSAGQNSGYRYFNVGGGHFDNMFRVSTQGKSAKDAIDTLLYNHSYCIESVTITSVPIYYLEPNTRIYISDIEANIEGEYILSKFTIPLHYNGTMSLTATKAVNRLL